jgi:histone arginine demethylase JMJD6
MSKRLIDRVSTEFASTFLKIRSHFSTERIKRNFRPEFQAQDWNRHGFSRCTPSITEQALSAVQEHQKLGGGMLDVLHASSLSTERFRREYDEQCRPVAIQGLTDAWGCHHSWSLDAFASGPYRDVRVKCSQSRLGARIALRDFVDYLRHTDDDSPLYVFDPAIAELAAGRMLADYAVPPLFAAPDPLALLADDRPPHRWLLVGPRRSGSAPHVDPHGTSAWNALVSGLKLWLLYPPSASSASPPPLAGIDRDATGYGSGGGGSSSSGGSSGSGGGAATESVHWFAGAALPRMRRPPRRAGGWIAHVQRPGETLFVPGGWRHAVLNLDHSVAVTHNLCTAANFPAVWRSLRSAPAAAAWLRSIDATYPHLARRARAADAADAAAAAAATSQAWRE